MSSFPPPPLNTIDWSTLGFGVRDVNGHIESSWSLKTGKWSAPKLVTDPYLRIHGLCPGLNYGLQAFEGMKAFRTPTNRIAVFRPRKNAARLERSATFLAIPSVPQDHFLKCIRLAVGANAEYVPPHDSDAAMYIRPVIFGTGAQLSLAPPEEYLFCVYVAPIAAHHCAHPINAIILEEFDRAAPEGTGAVKIGGNYAPVFHFSENAKRDGYGITLHLDSKTRSEVEEFTTSAFIGVKTDGKNTTLFVPDSKNVIESVTSESACAIAAFIFGWKVERGCISIHELPFFEEIIAAGTAASLVAIKSINIIAQKRIIVYRHGIDGPGPVISMLLEKLNEIQTGKYDYFGWLDYIEEPKELFLGQAAAEANEVRNRDGQMGLFIV